MGIVLNYVFLLKNYFVLSVKCYARLELTQSELSTYHFSFNIIRSGKNFLIVYFCFIIL